MKDMEKLHPAKQEPAPQRKRGMNASTQALLVQRMADAEFRKSIPGRALYLSYRYGIPLIELGLFLGVADRTVHRWLYGVSWVRSSTVTAELQSKLLTLEQSAQFLDEKNFRPRTWREALALCETELTRQN